MYGSSPAVAESGVNGACSEADIKRFDLRKLALSVARCTDVDLARSNHALPCHDVVCSQSGKTGEWQVPEAWAGNLSDGRIIYVSSNPSISHAGDAQSGDIAEDYPRGSWDNTRIADFVINRFS